MEVRNVCFSYGKKKILAGLSLRVEPGTCTVLAGPNGSGKSTALSLMAGVLKPDRGSVEPGGTVGFVPQGTALFEDLTVEDNLRFFSGLAGSAVPGTLPFGIAEFLRQKVGKLSGGMKKQVSIACALVGEPQVLLLDEPCAALDLPYRQELSQLLLQLKQQGRRIVYVGHEPMEFADFFDQVVFFQEDYPCVPCHRLAGDGESVDQLCRNFAELFK